VNNPEEGTQNSEHGVSYNKEDSFECSSTFATPIHMVIQNIFEIK
jgi:hypothetical protein